MHTKSKEYRKKRRWLVVKLTCLSLFALTTLFPFYWVLISSFKSTADIYGKPLAWPEAFEFSNYQEAWYGAFIGNSLVNSIAYTIIAVVVILLTTSMVSYVIARSKYGKYLYRFFPLELWSRCIR